MSGALQFLSPEWILIAPIFALIGRLFPHLGLGQPLRAGCLLLITVILMEPQLKTSLDGLDLWVLVDRSHSAASSLEPRISEWEDLLEKSRGSDDRLFFVEFAERAMVRSQGDASVYVDGRSQTNIAQAIDFTLAQLSPEKASRLLLISDAASTDPLTGIAERLYEHQVSLDFRLLRPEPGADFAVRRFQSAPRVLPGEPLLIEGEVIGTEDRTLRYQVRRGDEIARSGTVEIIDGRGLLQFTDQRGEPGSYQYHLEILDHDVRPGNNSAVSWSEVVGKPLLMVVSPYPDDPLVRALRRADTRPRHVTDPETLDAASLSGVRAVVLNNVAAHHLSPEFLAALDFFVSVQGGGLAMIGGENSFGSGGYYGSPIDPLLPVATELREEHRKYNVAMAIVLDRSGSMSAAVGGGTAGQLRKMDLANEGAAEAISLLGPRDMVTVFAVDSEAHIVVPLIQVGPNRGTLLNTVRGVNSEGGGIYVYEGLSAAWQQVSRSPIPQKHIILFSDAADSEEPGSYKSLLSTIRKAGGTVSVIGLGTPKDTDADLLKDIAKRGEGRIFFSNDAKELPALFAQETVSVARSSFITDPTKIADTGGWRELAAASLSWAERVDGYNLSYLKPEATAAAIAVDEYSAPLVAFWNRGIGRAAAVTFPMAGAHSQSQLQWAQYTVFTQTLSDWLMGAEQQPGISVRTKVVGQTLQLELFYGSQWEKQIALNPPQTIINRRGKTTNETLEWRRVAPGSYSTRIELKGTEPVRGAVQIGSTALPFGPIGSGIDPEWQRDPSQIAELKTLAKLTGGTERLDLTGSWQAPRRSSFQPLRAYLLWLLLVLMLVEALLTRLGVALPQLALRRRVKAPDPAAATENS